MSAPDRVRMTRIRQGLDSAMKKSQNNEILWDMDWLWHRVCDLEQECEDARRDAIYRREKDDMRRDD